MSSPESEPRTATRPAAASAPHAAAGAAPKRTLEECVNDILEYICNRFGNPSEFEALVQELQSLAPSTSKG